MFRVRLVPPSSLFREPLGTIRRMQQNAISVKRKLNREYAFPLLFRALFFKGLERAASEKTVDKTKADRNVCTLFAGPLQNHARIGTDPKAGAAAVRQDSTLGLGPVVNLHRFPGCHCTY